MNQLPSSMQSSFGSDEPEPILAGLSDGGDGAAADAGGLDPKPAKEQAPSKRRAKDSADKAAPNARRRTASAPVLGIYVTPTAVHGVLVRESGDNYGVMRPFTRQRSAYAGEVPDLAALTPEGEAADGDGDITIQFGDAASDLGASDLFLDSEFSDLAGIEPAEGEFQGPAKKSASPIVFELKDILDECGTAGHEKSPAAFCLSQPDVEYVELVMTEDKKEKKDKEKKDKKDAKDKKAPAAAEADAPVVKRDRLLERLAAEYDEAFDKERVAFLPMTPRDGQQRFLAVVPTPEESLAPSLELLREQAGMRSVPFRTIDAEVPILVGLARWTFPAEPHENTAIVRVGSEDTLVILLQGGTLHHTEHMRSVTTFDGPDTICSRVLLQQDVQGVGTVHHVVVLSDERERELVQGFGAFYPDANVAALREGLVRAGVMPSASDAALPAKMLPAIGAALRVLMERQKDSPFFDINMLPKRLRRRSRKIDLAVAWHTLVAGVLVFFAVLFFMGIYFSQQGDIQQAQARVDAYPDEINLSGPALQAQIDSLEAVHLRITKTLNTIDSLLVGSDRWSRTLAHTARATASTGGAWVGQWNPADRGLRLTGFAMTRDQVVQFAERMDATIEEVKFEEIREYPVFSYIMSVPVKDELPQVARYLRERADASGAIQDPLPADQDPLTDYEPASASGR